MQGSIRERQANVSNGVVDLGSFSELCNNREGYRVVLQHPEGLNASVEVNGFAIPLSQGSETVIVDYNQPEYRTSHARLRLASNDLLMPTLGFRIEPKGAIY